MHTMAATQRISAFSRRGNAMGWNLSASACRATETDPHTAVVCITQHVVAVQQSGSSDG